jgi:hypothetical protein
MAMRNIRNLLLVAAFFAIVSLAFISTVLGDPSPTQPGSLVRSWNSQNGPYFTIFDVDNPGTLPVVAPFPAGGNFIGAGEYINGLSYMIDDANNVYVVDDTGSIQSTYAATPPPNGETYTGMALNAANGQVFVTSTNGITSSICRFNIFTGNVTNCNTISGLPGNRVPAALAITEARDANWVISVTYHHVSVLHKIDPFTGITSNVTPLPFDAGPEVGLACDPVTGLLVMPAYNNDTDRGELWTVDISDESAPVFNFVEVLGVSFPGGSNQLTWAGIELPVFESWRYVYMPAVLNTE